MTGERIVVNASPLIALFRSAMDDLLPVLFDEIAVPDAVWREVTAGGHQDVAALGLERAAWAVRLPDRTADPLIVAWDLGAGETAVLDHARRHPGYRVVLDDAAARRCARALNLRLRGTGGILLLAKRKGLLDSVERGLISLRKSGLWLDDRLIALLLQEAGEG